MTSTKTVGHIITCIGIIFSSSACSSKTNNPSPVTSSIASGVRWNIDGNNANVVSSSIKVNGTASAINLILDCSALVGNLSHDLTMVMPKLVGTFGLPDANGRTAALYMTSSNVGYSATSGTIAITNYKQSPTPGGSNVTGTFSFTGTAAPQSTTTPKTVSITSGSFNVDF